MFRVVAASCAFGVMLIAGCATSHDQFEPEPKAAPKTAPAGEYEHPVDVDRHETTVVERPSPTLLFDRRPGRIPPDAFTFRYDWPAVDRPYAANDVIYYIETVRDYEGLRGPWQNQTRRYYRGYRVGATAP